MYNNTYLDKKYLVITDYYQKVIPLNHFLKAPHPQDT